MQNLESIKTTFVKNLNKQIFSSTINVPIDNNVNIKTILNIDSYIFGEKIECSLGKANISGKVGIKVIYLDTDNMTNTISDQQSFNETIIDPSITADSVIFSSSTSVNCQIVSRDNPLKVACEISVTPIMFINLSVGNSLTNIEDLITKKNEMTTTCVNKVLSESFEYSTSFETKDNITKILGVNSYFALQSAEAKQDLLVVDGKLYQTLLYETSENDECVLKEINDCFAVKYDINVADLTGECTLDVAVRIDKSKENVNTSLENDSSVIDIVNTLCVAGVATKEISLEYVDDLYSLDNETECVTKERDFFYKPHQMTIKENVAGEITLEDSEPAIENLISNMSIMADITNTYIKNGSVCLEGVITSHLVYLDENREYQQKQIELPFVIDSKYNAESLPCYFDNAQVLDCKCKVKRGTVIELSYAVEFCVSLYTKSSVSMIDNVKIGSPINTSQYDFQIYIGKADETMWELCKRIKTTPENLLKTNKDLPSVMQGGEKIIVRR